MNVLWHDMLLNKHCNVQLGPTQSQSKMWL